MIGGRWRAAPEQMKLASAPDLLETCSHLIDRDTMSYLTHAFETKGNFVIRDWPASVLQIYAPAVGIAAYLSFAPSRFDRQAPTLPSLP